MKPRVLIFMYCEEQLDVFPADLQGLGGLHGERFARFTSWVAGSVKRAQSSRAWGPNKQDWSLGAGGWGSYVCCFFSSGSLSL